MGSRRGKDFVSCPPIARPPGGYHARFLLLAALCPAFPALSEEETWLRAKYPENASYFAPKLRVSRMQDSPAIWPGAGIE